ncbi:MAG: hypothetical protein EXQ92_12940 [Alphaproteobacteria bacterium]|nr:hypothetical protein [Alphaproteobacteria bacterium]
MLVPPPTQITPVLPQFALIRPAIEQQTTPQITRVAIQPSRESRGTEAQRERNDRSERVDTSGSNPAQRGAASPGRSGQQRGLNLDITA